MAPRLRSCCHQRPSIFLEAPGVFLPRHCAHFMISLAFLCGAFLFERISLSQRAKTVPCCLIFPIFKETHDEIEICLEQNDHQSLKSYLSHASSAPIRQQLSNKLSQNGNIWEYMGIYGNIWEYMGIYGNIWEYMGIYGNIWEYIMVCLTASTIHPFIVSAQLSATPGVSHFQRHPQIAAIETICPWRAQPVRICGGRYQRLLARSAGGFAGTPGKEAFFNTCSTKRGDPLDSLDHKNIISIIILLAMFA